MDIKAITTEADYDKALVEVERYFINEPEPGSAEAERFSALTDIIEAYENQHWPIEMTEP
ncbi:transcriptional regulator [Chelatococcus sp. YT9]|uniref:transcriptional regulator n=1 Tax=Chelatococcus sp. YT9 TaxID=2835635 RepID=UPI001BD0145B|nr:transcriptional regulator [Chelatococcus sp. YT9]MBS7698605.1 transcriptional regulator [Chelatococcus sp. YT9]